MNWRKKTKTTEEASPKVAPYWSAQHVPIQPVPRTKTQVEQDEEFFKDWAARMRGER